MKIFETHEKVFLKKEHYWVIHDFVYRNDRNRLQGKKLEALYRLIQLKGKPLDFGTDHEFYGVKVIEYADQDFIGFIRTGISKKTFFPCKLKIVALRALGNLGKSKSMVHK
ncbi:hypothetical protein [Maribacter sp. Hel_I_7]|uniref:hypothetical protein n=1 Tax=Maribacter sp. Hel_I_7 TaxID=1249997 RepID=UPI00047C4E4C|nr:hypothetical protein [Maribacter sp. Hel_I_7]